MSMVNNKNFFSTFSPTYTNISQGDGSQIIASGIGDIGPLKHVLFVPQLKYNLLSVSYFTKLGFKILFDTDDSVKIIDKNNQSLTIGNRSNKLFYSNNSILDLQSINSENCFIVKNNNKYALWHRRFVHINPYYIYQAINLQLIIGVDSLYIDYQYHCHVCKLCKMTKQPVKSNIETKTSKTLNKNSNQTNNQSILHNFHLIKNIPHISFIKWACDLKGPLPLSIHKNQWVLLFTSYTSRYRFVYFLKFKNDTIQTFKNFINKIKRFQYTSNSFILLNKDIELDLNDESFRNIPIEIKSDNGTEFVNNELNDLFLHNNIYQQTSSPYSPFQNGIAERSNRTIFELAACLLTDSNVPLYLWEYAVSTVVHTLNLLPNKALSLASTPFMELFHKPPNVSHLRVFGSPTYALLQDHERPSVGVRAYNGKFVGYDDTSLSYLIYYNHSVYRSRDVVFHESAIINKQSENENLYEEIAKLFGINTDTTNKFKLITEKIDNNIKNNDNNQPEPTKYNLRSSSLPIAKSNNSYNLRSKQLMCTLTTGKFFIKSNIDDFIFAEIIDENDIDPHDPNWIEAKKTEINRLQNLPTWLIVDNIIIPSNQKPLKFKWVYSRKFDVFLKKNIYKARLTIKGCSQIPGIDFTETFSPVAQVTTFRLMLALTAGQGLIAYQFDIQNAFPNATLNDVQIFMVPPPELNLPTGKSLKLLRALYGLKQASREWFLLLTSSLAKLGFKICRSDSCLLYIIQNDIIIIVTIYVDDFLVSSNNIKHIYWLHSQLSKHFVVNMTPLTKIIGFSIKYDPNKQFMAIDKNDYTLKTISKFKYLLDHTSSQHTPIDKNIKLTKPTTQIENNTFPFRPIIGSISYLSHTFRADISFGTNYLARFMDNFDDSHILQCKNIVRYLSDNPLAEIHYCNLNIYPKYFIINNQYQRMIPNQLYAFVDADWASSDIEKRRSTTGYLIFFNGGLISWKTSLQKRTASSSTEAEYIALNEVAKEVVWLKHILEELNLFTVNAVIIYEDNSSAINASYNPVEHSKLKHLAITYHSIRDFINSNDITMRLIQSSDQMADSLTKGHSSSDHLRLVNRYINLLPVRKLY